MHRIASHFFVPFNHVMIIPALAYYEFLVFGI